MRLVFALEGIGGTTRCLRTWRDPKSGDLIDVFTDDGC